MRGTNILLVTDDCETGRFWSYALSMRGANVTTSGITDSAFEHYQQGHFDITVIVCLRDDQKGIELARQLRAIAFNPILLLMPRYDENLILRAYGSGIDECIVSPISPAVFLAKISAWMRHSWTISASIVPIQETATLSFDPVKRNVITASGKSAKLTNLELRLLSLLMLNHGQILHPEQIINRVWGYPEIGDTEMLKSLIYRLRNKIECDPRNPKLILTIPGEGYTFASTTTSNLSPH